MKVKSSREKVWDWVFVIFCVFVGLICVIPMVNLLAKSLSGTDYLIRNEI